MSDTPPAVILVRPQMAENIGATARAMKNCALDDLRLVAPQGAWPDDRARPPASGAEGILDNATVHDTVPAAVADLHALYATSSRDRGFVRTVMTPRRAADSMRRRAAAGDRAGVLFGPERTGLTNDELGVADAEISVPLNPGFASLNLAQAVLLVGYEWFQAGDTTPDEHLATRSSGAATRAELGGVFDHLERELTDSGFLKVPEKRANMMRNIRAMFQRANLTKQEVRTLRGIVVSLSGLRDKRRSGEGS